MTNFILFCVGLTYGRFPRRSQKRSVHLKEKSLGERLDQGKVCLENTTKLSTCKDCIKRMTGNLRICWKIRVGWTYRKDDQQQIPKRNFEMKSQKKKVPWSAEVKIGRRSAEGSCHSPNRTNWRAAVTYKNNWKKKTWEAPREEIVRRDIRKRFHVRLSEGTWPRLREKVLRGRNKGDRNRMNEKMRTFVIVVALFHIIRVINLSQPAGYVMQQQV